MLIPIFVHEVQSWPFVLIVHVAGHDSWALTCETGIWTNNTVLIQFAVALSDGFPWGW